MSLKSLHILFTSAIIYARLLTYPVNNHVQIAYIRVRSQTERIRPCTHKNTSLFEKKEEIGENIDGFKHINIDGEIGIIRDK